MFKITNVSVGHLYDFSDFMWSQIENSYDSTQSIMLFFMIIPNIVVKVEGEFSWPWLEYYY